MNPSSTVLETAEALRESGKALARYRARGVLYEWKLSVHSLWLIAHAGEGAIALRVAHAPQRLSVTRKPRNTAQGAIELRCESAVLRVDYELPRPRRPILHYTTRLLPSRALQLANYPRDLYALGDDGTPLTARGTVHTAQRGPRTGIVFATLTEPAGGTFLYWQNLSALNEYAQATHTTPAGRVGGAWPEMGYSPAHDDEHPLPAANEVVISDVFFAYNRGVPAGDGDAAALFLDQLAEVYQALPRPQPHYRDWPAKSEQTVRDLAFSPECTDVRQGGRYLLPYVGDREKPPESMVQFTVLLPLLEYEQWTQKRFVLTRRLLESFPEFFDRSVGSIVRWLPGERFGNTGEAGQSHENMDSWYLYHVLFNCSRLASLGNAGARKILAASLPYAMRVARRFDYRFPVFFNTHTLEVVRAESKPGAGGERDVAGLYALCMLHAHELFGGREYLDEAQRAAEALTGLGFSLGYQMNTTGFTAEAMLRLFLKTGEGRYLDRMNVALANVFENMWIWECRYGHAAHYPTFFGLFPLRDAPYLAPYEELEALAKFHDLLKMGGESIRPSARLLIAEYGKYALDRVWHYFPESLPVDALADKPRNGRIERALAVPVEDLQDGWEQSGQVGQEIYGAGVALVYTTRHFKKLSGDVIAFCEYPMLDVGLDARRLRFQTGGDERLRALVRLIPRDAAKKPPPMVLKVNGKAVRGALCTRGHLCFEVPGNAAIEVRW